MKNYFLLSSQKRIYVEDNNVFIDDNKIADIGKITPEQYAIAELRQFYKKYLSNHFENLVVLSGAGSSIGIGNEGRKGKTRVELWKSVVSEITPDIMKTFCSAIGFNYPANDNDGDLEALLSKSYRAKEFKEGKIKDEHTIESIIKKIEKKIKEDCSLELPDKSPHETFLKKITTRKLKYPRAKIFTLNYDTLFEQAGVKAGFTIIDGFSFSFPRKFNGQFYDYDIVIREKSRLHTEDNYVKRVFHIYKPHGSLDWERLGNDVVKTIKPKNPLIIYPKDSKYESSYEQPFFEMMSRLQQALRSDNVLLICIGFSFYDKHIATILHEAVDSNNSFRLMVITKDISDNVYLQQLRDKVQVQNNIILIDESFDDFALNYPFPKSYEEDYLTVKIKKSELDNEN